MTVKIRIMKSSRTYRSRQLEGCSNISIEVDICSLITESGSNNRSGNASVGQVERKEGRSRV